MSQSSLTIREFTEYEKEKWFDDLNRFEMDEASFIFDGDEWGEAFDTACRAANQGDYGLADWFVAAAQIQALDMYYDQMLEAYVELMRYDGPEELGLPSIEEFQAKAQELGVAIDKLALWSSLGGVRTDEERKLWDWAMQWREDHEGETIDARKIRWHEQELKRLQEQRSAKV